MFAAESGVQTGNSSCEDDPSPGIRSDEGSASIPIRPDDPIGSVGRRPGKATAKARYVRVAHQHIYEIFSIRLFRCG